MLRITGCFTSPKWIPETSSLKITLALRSRKMNKRRVKQKWTCGKCRLLPTEPFAENKWIPFFWKCGSNLWKPSICCNLTQIYFVTLPCQIDEVFRCYLEEYFVHCNFEKNVAHCNVLARCWNIIILYYIILLFSLYHVCLKKFHRLISSVMDFEIMPCLWQTDIENEISWCWWKVHTFWTTTFL